MSNYITNDKTLEDKISSVKNSAENSMRDLRNSLKLKHSNKLEQTTCKTFKVTMQKEIQMSDKLRHENIKLLKELKSKIQQE